MPYITIYMPPWFHQITLDEIIAGDFIQQQPTARGDNTTTRTYYARQTPQRLLDAVNVQKLKRILKKWCDDHAGLYEVPRESLYDTFYIPKKSGGLREINAPKPELMNALRELKLIFERDFDAKYHTSAYAYVKHRSTIDAVKKHQMNNSNWFLKTDFSNFFGSTTPDFLYRSITSLFPFCVLTSDCEGSSLLRRALDLCFLNGGLPQGTPISPMLTNLMMIPIDHSLAGKLRNYKGRRYVYTRYADDCLISSVVNFDKDEVVSLMKEVLEYFHAPFEINDKKTRYGSKAGSNWNLGLMLNKDNEITFGYKNKQRFRAMISNYILDRQHGIAWSLHDVQVLRGMINYYKMIEKDYVKKVIAFNDEKYKTDVMQMIHEDLSA